MVHSYCRLQAAALVAGLLLAACGSGSGTDDATSSVSVTDIETTSSSAFSGNATLTPPGSVLGLNQQAFVPLEVNGLSGVIAVAITSVMAGAPADLKALQIAAGDPFYVNMRITNTGAPPDLGNYVPELYAVRSDGIQALAVNEPPTFLQCLGRGPTTLALGASMDTCEAYVSESGKPVTSIQYIDPAGDKPITWRLG
jgi:hypothetical protein